MKTILLLSLLTCHGCLMAQTPKVEITTKSNSEREKTIQALLNEVLSERDLGKWTFTQKVIIEQAAIPHSHPVLTVGTSSNDKDYILSTYIHEQLHWYVDKYPEALETAIAEFRKRYANVPFQNRAGAQDEYSTYLHLIVCYLEYRSMASLIGEEKAKQFMWNQNHYTWVYNKIIEDATFIGGVLKKNGFDLVE